MGDAATTQPQPRERLVPPGVRRPGLAVPLWLLSLVLAAAVVGLIVNTPSEVRGAADPIVGLLLAVVVAYSSVGAVVAGRRPQSYAGWTMLGLGLSLAAIFVLVGWTFAALPPSTLALPGGVVTLWLSDIAFTPTFAGFASLFLLLFPDGRLPSRRWRAAVGIVIASVLLFLVAEGIRPGFVYEDHPTIANPFGAPAGWGAAIEALVTIGNAGLVVSILLAACSLLIRYRSVDEIERHQIKWIAVVGAGSALAFAVASLQWSGISDVAWILGLVLFTLLPVAIGFAITRYRLYDIDQIVNRAIVYGGVTAILAGVFAASISLSQRIFVGVTGQSSDAAIVITTLIVTSAYTPVRRRVESFVDRTLRFDSRRFGAYREQLGRALEVFEPDTARERLVREAVEEFRATAGAVLGRDDELVTAGPGWTETSVPRIEVPLGPGGERLVLGRRRDRAAYSPRDVEELRDVASLAGKAMDLVAAHRRAAEGVTAPAVAGRRRVIPSARNRAEEPDAGGDSRDDGGGNGEG